MPAPIRRRIVPLAALALAAAAVPALAAPGDVSIASLSSAGALGNQPAEAGAVSADGRYVAFTSAADLTGTPVGNVVQLYVRDRETGTTTLASASAAGAPANAAVDVEDVGNVQFSLSGDGRYAVFASTATNLTPADADNAKDVYRKDLQTGAVDLVSVDSAGQKANAGVAGDPDVSYDGTRVSFGSGAATNLFGTDANNASSDVVVRDIAAGTTVLAAQSTAGVQAAGTTERSAISQDGRVVVFTAVAGSDNLVPGDAGTDNDTIVRDLGAGTTRAASDVTLPAGSSNFPDVSGDGRYVVHETSDAYDAANDANAANDVYRTDMLTGAVTLISARDGLAGAGNQGGTRPSISADGTRVAFQSTSTNLTANDADATVDVFTRTLPTATALASVRADGTTKANTDSLRPALAAAGGAVAFAFDDNGAATKLVPTDANAKSDVHVKELTPTDATGPAITLSSPADGASTADPQVTVSGTAADASGIGSLTVNDQRVAPGADGSFSAAVALAVGTSAITVRAVDGAGNATTTTRTVTRVPASTPTSPGTPSTGGGGGGGGESSARAARATGLSVGIRGKRVRVAFTLSGNARVRATLLRRVVVRAKRPNAGKAARRVVYRPVASRVAPSLSAGRRAISITTARRPAVGRYRVRLVVTSTGGVTRAAKDLRVRPPRKVRA